MAIRQGNRKPVWGFDPDATPKPAPRASLYCVTPPQLSDLAADPLETRDLAAAHPAKAATLQALYARWNAGNQDPLWLPNLTIPATKQE